MNWPEIRGLEKITSPGLLVDADRVGRNIDRMISAVGREGIGRLRPHVKTHKMSEVMRLQIVAGITKFKAATLAELEMAAGAGAKDVLLAVQPVGPAIARLGRAVGKYPETLISAVVDDVAVAERIDSEIGNAAKPVRLWIDVDCGMRRTGVEMGSEMEALRKRIEKLPGVEFGGIHVYDGHIHAPGLAEREAAVVPILEGVRKYLEGGGVPATVVGGSPTFGIWARETRWECSPGTVLFWDAGYGRSYPDLEFEVAAALLARVVSRPGEGMLCLDLGHKAVAAENPLERRVFFPDLPGAVPVMQSEEHLVMRTELADDFALGDTLVGIPQHICPTVALHATASVVRNGVFTGETWRVAARDR